MENLNDKSLSNVEPGQTSSELSPLAVEAILYGVIALAMTATWVFINKSPSISTANLFMKLLAILVGGGIGTVGALIGNALRKAVHPDAVFTTGGFWSLLWTKVFWRLGPQTIGMVAGTFIGIALVIH